MWLDIYKFDAKNKAKSQMDPLKNWTIVLKNQLTPGLLFSLLLLFDHFKQLVCYEFTAAVLQS